MKLEKAHSEDLHINITADAADRKYADGQVSSKFHFRCPDENCSAPVTCANLDKPESRRKRDPYYKVVGEHSEECLIGKDIQSMKRRSRGYEDIYSDSDEYFSHAVRLNLQSPSAKRLDSEGRANEQSNSTGKLKSNSSEGEGKRKIQRSKTLSSLIDAFLEKAPMTIQLPEVGLIDIQDLFIEIDGQAISTFPDEFRIYYGKAWINKRKGGYGFCFANHLTSGELTAQPSTYLPMDKIEEGTFARFEQNRLDKLANNLPKTVFLLAETTPRPNGEYINIWCEGPEYLDYRL